MKDRFLGNSVRVRVAFPSSLNTNAISVVVFSSTYAPEAREKKKTRVPKSLRSVRDIPRNEGLIFPFRYARPRTFHRQ